MVSADLHGDHARKSVYRCLRGRNVERFHDAAKIAVVRIKAMDSYVDLPRFVLLGVGDVLSSGKSLRH